MNRVGDDPYKASRFLGDDYLFRLPGEEESRCEKSWKRNYPLNYKGFIKKFL